jgi:hypothetical protein
MPVSGPFFDARAEIIMVRGCARLRAAVAKEADRRIEILHKAFFRLPTPYYWTKVHAESRGPVDVITDGGIVYGPWLEGTGSRNAPVTRFKGYRSARLTAQSLRNARVVTDPVVREICREMNA